MGLTSGERQRASQAQTCHPQMSPSPHLRPILRLSNILTDQAGAEISPTRRVPRARAEALHSWVRQPVLALTLTSV